MTLFKCTHTSYSYTQLLLHVPNTRWCDNFKTLPSKMFTYVLASGDLVTYSSVCKYFVMLVQVLSLNAAQSPACRTHTHTLASARPPLRLLSLCVCASFLSHTCVYLRSLLHGHIKTEMFFHQMLNRCGDKQVISMLMTRLSLCEPMKLKVKHFQFQHWFFLTPLSEIKLVKLTNNELKLLKFYCICTQIRSF